VETSTSWLAPSGCRWIATASAAGRSAGSFSKRPINASTPPAESRPRRCLDGSPRLRSWRMRRERDGPPRSSVRYASGPPRRERSWRGVRHRPRGRSCRARDAHGAGEVARTPRCSTSAPPPPDTSTHCVDTSWRTSLRETQTAARLGGGPLTFQGQCQRQVPGSVAKIRSERSAARPENAGPPGQESAHHWTWDVAGVRRAAVRAPNCDSGCRASEPRGGPRSSSGGRRPLGRSRHPVAATPS
jgi:hypothetical protein